MKKIDKLINKDIEEINKLDEMTKKRILLKSKAKLSNKFKQVKSIAAVLVLIIILSGFIKGTPVNALIRNTFSFIPGVGVMENNGDLEFKAVLDQQVKVTKNDRTIEIYVAYIQGNYVNVKVETDIFKNEMTEKEKLEYYSNESFEDIYLIVDGEKIKSSHLTSTIDLFEVGFILKNEYKGNEKLELLIEEIDIVIEFSMSSVFTSENIGDMGSYAVVDDVMFLANMEREKNEVKVQINSLTEQNYNHISFEWFEHENILFDEPVHIIDEDGNKYYPLDEEVNKNKYRNTFYFDIPEELDNLKLIIPQFLYEVEYEKKHKVILPNENEKIFDVYSFSTKYYDVSVNEIEYLEEHYHVKFNFSAIEKVEDSNTIIRRVIPTFYEKIGVFDRFLVSMSQSVYSEAWIDSQGEVFGEYENVKERDKVTIGYNIEYAYINEIVLNLK